MSDKLKDDQTNPAKVETITSRVDFPEFSKHLLQENKNWPYLSQVAKIQQMLV